MKLRKSIFLTIFLALSMLPFFASAEQAVENKEVNVSDCKVDAYAGDLLQNLIFKMSDCLIDASTDDLLTETEKNMNRQIESNTEFITDSEETAKEFYVLSFAFLMIMFLVSNSKLKELSNDPSDTVMRILVSVFLSTVLFTSSIAIWKFAGFFFQVSSLVPTSAAVQLAAQDLDEKIKKVEGELIENDLTMESTGKKAITTTSINIAKSVMDSELCSLKYVQEHQTATFDYKTTTPDIYNSDELMSCIEKEKAAASDSIFDNGGRSKLNYAVKKCSVKHASIDHDCGSITYGNTGALISSTVDTAATGFIATAHELDKSFCTIQLKEKNNDEDAMYGICREWNGEKFQLKSLPEENYTTAKTLLAGQISLLTTNITVSIAKSIEGSDALGQEIRLFSFLEQIYGLMADDLQEGSSRALIEETVSSFDYRNSYINNKAKGNDVEYVADVYQKVENVNDYMDKIMVSYHTFLEDSMHRSFDELKNFWESMLDAKRIIGDYKTTSDGYQNFEVDALAFKAVHQYSEDLYWTAFGWKFVAHNLMNTPSKMLRMLGATLDKALTFFISMMLIWICYLMFNIVGKWFISLYVGLTVKIFKLYSTMMVLFITRSSADTVVMALIDFFLTFSKAIIFLFTVVTMSFSMGLIYDIITEALYQFFGSEYFLLNIGHSIGIMLGVLILFIYIFEVVMKTVEKTHNSLISMSGLQQADMDSVENVANGSLNSIKANIQRNI